MDREAGLLAEWRLSPSLTRALQTDECRKHSRIHRRAAGHLTAKSLDERL